MQTMVYPPGDSPAGFALPEIGETVNHRYIIKSIIGRGGFGVVFHALAADARARIRGLASPPSTTR